MAGPAGYRSVRAGPLGSRAVNDEGPRRSGGRELRGHEVSEGTARVCHARSGAHEGDAAVRLQADGEFEVVVVGRGAAHRPPLLSALKSGAVFGVIEAITPVIGWALGLVAAGFVASIDHWIAFVLLAGVGGMMIVQAVRGGDGEEADLGTDPTATDTDGDGVPDVIVGASGADDNGDYSGAAYVYSGATGALYNNATQVVMMREGTRAVVADSLVDRLPVHGGSSHSRRCCSL